MDRQVRSLHLDDGETIPVRISTSENTTLIERQQPLRFLEHITKGQWSASRTPDTYLRGCVPPNEGALVCLCDHFGMLADEIVRLTNEEAQTLILDRLS
ncbi:MAG TPA: hypothetical protein VMU54_19645 [Planctomycetota bacterium]|nr:hypothetical protein [Planctomycetota bacterium]